MQGNKDFNSSKTFWKIVSRLELSFAGEMEQFLGY